MSSLFKGLSEHIRKFESVPLPNKVNPKNLFVGQVLAVLDGETFEQAYLTEELSALDDPTTAMKYIGLITFKAIGMDEGAYEDQTLRIAFPLDRGNYRLPIPGELVLIAGVNGPSNIPNDRIFHYANVITGYSTTHNSVDPYGVTPARKVKLSNTKLQLTSLDSKLEITKRFDSKLLHLQDTMYREGNVIPTMREGDRIIEGRFGNSIRFTSGFSKEDVWNRDSDTNKPTLYTTTVSNDGDPALIIKNSISPTAEKGIDDLKLVEEDINTDMSTIYMTTTQTAPLIVYTSNKLYTWDPDWHMPPLNEGSRLLTKIDLSADLSDFFPGRYDPSQKITVSVNVGNIQVGPNGNDNSGNIKGPADLAGIGPSVPATPDQVNAIVDAVEALQSVPHPLLPEKSSGYCGGGTSNLVYKYIIGLRAKFNQSTTFTMPKGYGAPYGANGKDVVRDVCSKFSYQSYDAGTLTHAQIAEILKNGPNGQGWAVGDVASYYTTDGGGAQQTYGHAQLFVGPEAAARIGAGSHDNGRNVGWTTDCRANYGCAMVYNAARGSTWRLFIGKAPTDAATVLNIPIPAKYDVK